MPGYCRPERGRCFWEEGGGCFCEDVASVTSSGGRRSGELFSDDLRARCDAKACFRGNRRMVASAIGNLLGQTPAQQIARRRADGDRGPMIFKVGDGG